VTVGTKELEILKSIVVTVSVDMVKRHAQWPTAPFSEAALLASILLEAGLD
jgi:hypothetical protein